MPVVAEVGSAANNYQVLAKLAMGGMAEIFLAKGASTGGVERYVVLKRILREKANDTHFVQMFLEEARLAAQLQHPNVAQVYDIGKLGDSYFFTMEYVHGETVRHLVHRASSLRREIPISSVLAVISGTAAGLHHAHARLGMDGRPLGIVHRDVSPSNLMISYEGSVKVVDFGVAKAENRATETREGTVKGKISYLSPEQCRGAPVDRRSDLFSLGIVMWEMLTAERLYRRGSDFEIMTAIVGEPSPPPSAFRPGLPYELDALVLRLLSKSPNDRYQSGDDVVEAIEEVAAQCNAQISQKALGKFVRELFGQRPEPWLELEKMGMEQRPEGVTVTSEPIPPEIAAGMSRVDAQLQELQDLRPAAPYSESSVPMRPSMAYEAQPGVPGVMPPKVLSQALTVAMHPGGSGDEDDDAAIRDDEHPTFAYAGERSGSSPALPAGPSPTHGRDVLATVPLRIPIPDAQVTLAVDRSTGPVMMGGASTAQGMGPPVTPSPTSPGHVPSSGPQYPMVGGGTAPSPVISPYPVVSSGPGSYSQSHAYPLTHQQATDALAPKRNTAVLLAVIGMALIFGSIGAYFAMRKGKSSAQESERVVMTSGGSDTEGSGSAAVAAEVDAAVAESVDAAPTITPTSGSDSDRTVTPDAGSNTPSTTQRTPAEQLERAFTDGKLGEVVAACKIALSPDTAYWCTLAACLTNDTSKARTYFAKLVPLKRPDVVRQCKARGIDPSASRSRPPSGGGKGSGEAAKDCDPLKDPMACQH